MPTKVSGIKIALGVTLAILTIIGIILLIKYYSGGGKNGTKSWTAPVARGVKPRPGDLSIGCSPGVANLDACQKLCLTKEGCNSLSFGSGPSAGKCCMQNTVTLPPDFNNPNPDPDWVSSYYI